MISPRDRPSLSERVLRGLLRAYPATFRKKFDTALYYGHSRELEEARRRGHVAMLRFWIATSFDTLAHGVLERVSPSENRVERGRASDSHPPLRYTVGEMLQDIRFGLRSLTRSPLSSLVSVLTLGVGIGATTAIFTVVDTVILEPLPYPDARELVAAYRTTEQNDRSTTSPLDAQDWGEQVSAFRESGAYAENSSDFTDDEGVEQVQGARLSVGILPTLGVSPALGRWFVEAEDQIGGPSAIILSQRFWRDRLGADPDIVGRTIDRDGDPHTVVGVMPSSFYFPTPQAEYWIPLRGDEALRLAGVESPGRGLGFVNVIARLSPGTTVAAARTELRTVTASIDAAEPNQDLTGANLISLHEATIGQVRLMLFTFLGAVAIVLLISCANVANLALARAASRSTEMAVRAALGAGRGRLIRLLLTESAIVGLAAGAVGILFAIAASGVLTSMVGDTIPRGHEIGVDGSVLAFAGSLSLGAGLFFGLFAALSASRPSIITGLKDGGRGSSGGRAAGALRNGLVVAQVALALALMTGAGLLTNSYVRLTNVDAGFRHENVLTARVSLPTERYSSDEAVLAFFDELTLGLERLPGVTNVTTSYSPPLAQSNFNQSIEPEGWEETDPDERPWVGTVIVGDAFFEASGVPILRGRGFDRSDRSGVPIAVINQAMLDRFWPDADPLGKRFRIAGGIMGSVESLEGRFFSRDWITVVGVSANVRREGIETRPQPEFYRPHAQMAWPGMGVLIRTTSRPERLIPALKAEVRALDKGLAITGISTLQQLVDQSTAAPRFRTILLGSFAVVAAFLAMIGIYGVMAFTVGQQRREIGIRMALGASGRRVRREIVLRGLRVAGLGVAVGLIVAFNASRALSAMVFGVSTHDPVTYALVTVGVFAVALAASYIPARRASRVEPTGALRGP